LARRTSARGSHFGALNAREQTRQPALRHSRFALWNFIFFGYRSNRKIQPHSFAIARRMDARPIFTEKTEHAGSLLRRAQLSAHRALRSKLFPDDDQTSTGWE
jgi:hypothetical protein